MPSTSIKFVAPLLEYLEANGEPSAPLLDAVGISYGGNNQEHPLSWEQLHALWGMASKQCDDPLIGLHVGLRIQPDNIGILGQALSNARTVEQAYTLLQRYGRLLYQAPLVDLVRRGDEAELRIIRDEDVDPQQVSPVIEFLLASLLHIAGTLMGGPSRGNQYLKRVQFRHPALASHTHYRRLCKTPEVNFEADFNALVFDAKVFDEPVLWADQARLASITEQADLALRKLATERDVVTRVRAAISRRLLGAAPSVVTIASDCAMSRATLQRKLAQQHTSYQSLLDETRLQIANDMLSDQRNRITDIALALGYSETAAFDHAYKRWTGRAPNQARQRTD